MVARGWNKHVPGLGLRSVEEAIGWYTIMGDEGKKGEGEMR